MQIDTIKVSDYLKSTEETNFLGKAVESKEAEASKATALRSISIDQAKYNKAGEPEEGLTDNLKRAQALELTDASQMGLLIDHHADAVAGELSDADEDPLDADVKKIVTVVEKVKMHAAGMSTADIEAMEESGATALAMERELNEKLTDENIKYLIDNALKPTIANLYDATYKAPAMNVAQEMTTEELEALLKELAGQINEVIEEAGLDTKDEKVISAVETMLKQGIGLTSENLEYFTKLRDYTKPATEEVKTAIADILLEDKPATDAYLIRGYSAMDQARGIMDEINAMDEDSLPTIEARLQLEQVRMMMTVEVNFTLIQRGISIDTSDLADTIQKLEARRQELIFILFGDKVDKGKEKLALYEEAMKAVADVKEMPAAFLGRIPNVTQATLSQVQTVAVSVEATYVKAQETYEALWTAPRADMGDTIKKAFANVDDILKDLDLPVNEAYEKAVRSLAYNETDLTKNNIETMKTANEMVKAAVGNMTPKVVTEMIKRGDNPLDMTMEELKEVTAEIKAEVSSESDEEGFAKFLWKLEHTEGISEQERNSFIGIYRMLHQIETSDGAAVGALIQQGSEVTLRNLLMAVRSEKHSGRSWEIGDDFGMSKEVIVKDLSITQQVEAAFHFGRLHDAKEAITPAKLLSFESEETYLAMSPDEFATALEEQEDAKTEAAYRESVAQEMRSAFRSEEEVYNALKNFDLPVTANNLVAMQQLMTNRNGAFRKVFGEFGDLDAISIEDLIDEITEEFMESCNNPEEMAEAQEALALRATNIMKTMLVEKEVATIDLKGMKLVRTQIATMGQLSQGQETYNLPIMVADELGNMTLKIVRGTNEAGLVKMALNVEATGVVTSSFRYEGGQINGEITCQREEVRAMLADNMQLIAGTLQERTGLSVTLSFRQEITVSDASIFTENEAEFKVERSQESQNRKDRDSIATRTLYGIARSFIEIFNELL